MLEDRRTKSLKILRWSENCKKWHNENLLFSDEFFLCRKNFEKKRGTKESLRNTSQKFQSDPKGTFREISPTKSIFGARKKSKSVTGTQKCTKIDITSQKFNIMGK